VTDSHPVREDPARALLLRAIERAGGIVDLAEMRAEALLPPPLARALNVPESARFAFSRTDAEASRASPATLATLSSPLIERLLAHLRLRVPVADLRLPAAYLKRERLTDALHAAVDFPNARVEIRPAIEARATYLVVQFRYVAAAETRSEGILAVTVNERSLAPVPGLAEALGRIDLVRHDRSEPPQDHLAGVLHRAGREAKRLVEERVRPFRNLLARRLARDHDRITAYYDELLREQARRARRRSDDPEARAQADEKYRATLADRDAKLSALAARYAVRATIRAFAAATLDLPVISVPVELKRRELRIETSFFWNPVLKAMEPAACSVCGTYTHALYLDERAELHCRRCHDREK